MFPPCGCVFQALEYTFQALGFLFQALEQRISFVQSLFIACTE